MEAAGVERPGEPVGRAAVAATQEAGPASGRRRLFPELLSVEALKAWMLFFGMKPATSKEFMVKRLREIDAYLGEGEPTQSGGGATALAAAAEGRPRGRPRKRPRPAEDEVAEAAEDAPTEAPGLQGAPAEPKAKMSAEAKAAAKAAKAAAKAAELERVMAEAIRGDTELHERLLLFEPVEIGELRERLVALRPELQGVGEQRLRKFLDDQGLLFANTWSQNDRVRQRR